jgi:RNA polymerase sigma-70 factor (ECF subfamily)
VIDITALHDELRPLMFSVAYGMLGSVSEAEDVTQEALLRMHREPAPIRSPSAYAVTVTTRLAIDELRSARARREVYVGSWLPEPLITGDAAGEPAARAEIAERLSTAFLVMLERLSPVERAVLLLREVFDYDYDQISVIVEKSAANCRQILARARTHLQQPQPRFAVSATPRAGEPLPRCVQQATWRRWNGCSPTTSSSPAAVARRNRAVPDRRTRVARFLVGLFRQARTGGIAVERTWVNGQPGFLARDVEGTPVAVMSLAIAEDGIRAIYNTINPDKLRHLAG